VNIGKHLERFLRIKSIDSINKEYFTEGNPAFWLALGMLLFSIWTIGVFESIEDYTDVIIFLVFLMGALWCTYWFFVILPYKKAPDNSPARLVWIEEKERKRDNPSSIVLLIGSITKFIGYLIVGALLIGLLFLGADLLSSLSVRSLLIIIIVLILVK